MLNLVVYGINDLIYLINPAFTILVERIKSVYGRTDATACNYNAAKNSSVYDLCYILTVVIDTLSLSSVLTAIVSPADSLVSFSWLCNGVEVGIESTYTALENGVYNVKVSNTICYASASLIFSMLFTQIKSYGS